MVHVLLQNDESTGRRRMAGTAGGASRHGNPLAVAIDGDPLVGDRHNDHNWSIGRTLGMPGELARLQFFWVGQLLFGRDQFVGEEEERRGGGALEKLAPAQLRERAELQVIACH